MMYKYVLGMVVAVMIFCVGCGEKSPVKPVPDVEYELIVTVEPVEGGSVSLDPPMEKYPANQKVIVTATAKRGFAFTGWSGASDAATNVITITMDENKELTAGFELLPTYTLKVTVDTAEGSVLLNPENDVYISGDKVTATATAKDGYAFVRWSGASTDTAATTTITMSGNLELIPVFKRIYTLEFGYWPSNSGSASVIPKKDIYVEGDEVTITATANKGYAFGSWEGLGSSGVDNTDSVVTITITGNRSITVNFVKVYTLTINIDPEDAGSLEFDLGYPEKPYYNESDTVLVKATAKSGYEFINWLYEDGTTQTGSVLRIVIGTKDVEVTAKFDPVEPTPLLTQGED